MIHFKVPTMMVVWPDDTPENPHYMATPLWNCRPDPLHWLATFAEAHLIHDDAGNVVAGNPPDFARVYQPDAIPDGYQTERWVRFLEETISAGPVAAAGR